LGGPEAEGAVHALGGAAATITLLARALRLDRVALVVRAADRPGLTPLAVHGDLRDVEWHLERPDDSRWSAVVPIGGEPTRGFLLLGRADREPLSEQDWRLAASVAASPGFAGTAPAEPSPLAAARDRLAHADRLAAIGTLAAGVAHEIRNPLVSVRTFIQLLPERLHDEEFRTNFRELALGEIERICGLINDLLAFSKPTPGEREPTDPAELARQTVRLLDAEARKHDVRLGCAIDAATPRVLADESQVKQVLMNVVLNAIQASPAPGVVQVGARGERHAGQRWCTIEVADGGPGICTADAGRIFDPFYTTKDLGSGLGLFIARRIVDEHGGTIHASVRPEGGCLFTIRLPALAEGDDGRPA
jgi:signal transduction histidine kinase